MPEYGCFVCGKGKTIDLRATCSECGNPFDVAPLLLSYKFGNCEPSGELGRGFYGTVLLAKDQIGKKFALKVCSSAQYQERQKDFTSEIQKYLAVGDHPNIAELIDGGHTTIEIRSQTLTVYYLVTKYLENAKTLEAFIREGTFNVEDMIGIAVQICAAIARVEERELWHNDLHGRNVLLAPRDSDDLNHHPTASRLVVKVVDFGSAVFKHPAPDKEWQDIQWVAKHLDSMLKNIRQRADQLAKSDRWFLKQLPELIDEGSDADPSRRMHSVKGFADKLNLLWQKSARHGEWQPVRLLSAFGYTNANAFPDDSYVCALFSDNFPWLAKIADGESNILLTGPRGCGKTMILRSLRLRSLIARQQEDETSQQRLKRVHDAPVVGFFVSARLAVGLYRSLGETPAWLSTPELSNCFFTLAFLQEIVDSFLYASEEDLKLLSPAETEELCNLTESQLGKFTTSSARTTVIHFSRLERLSRTLEQFISQIVDGHVRVADVPVKLRGARALLAIWECLKKQTRVFRTKRIIFLLDDFTQPLIPEKTQRTFLPVTFGTPQYQFIVSAHSRSVALEDLNGVRYDPSREFTEINLGAEFVKESDHASRCEEFLDDIFKRRFLRTTANHNAFKGKQLRDLLGTSSYHGGNIAEEIAYRHKTKKLRGLKIHGVDTLIQLCTGDVSSIIDLVGSLFQRHKESTEKLPLPPAKQNRAIRLYGRREIMKLLDIRQSDGRHLYEIATKFGQMSREKIIAYALSRKRDKATRVPQYLRIEMEQEISLPAKESEMLRALLQYGVFVDGGPGSAANGTPTQILIFRKVFCPVFPTGTASRDSFSWTTATISRFLKNPNAVRFEERRKHATTGDLFQQVDVKAVDDLGEIDDLERA